MKTLGPLYVSTLKYPHRKLLPVVARGWTQETEHPFRRSRVCLVFRVPFTKPGFVLGVFGSTEHSEDVALHRALEARFITHDPREIDEW